MATSVGISACSSAIDADGLSRVGRHDDRDRRLAATDRGLGLVRVDGVYPEGRVGWRRREAPGIDPRDGIVASTWTGAPSDTPAITAKKNGATTIESSVAGSAMRRRSSRAVSTNPARTVCFTSPPRL